ncbi:MAG: M15 family metallopeptidase [Solobacterium sp.]|nr:M15 family metallopeptidase [Solobacterium sp.]
MSEKKRAKGKKKPRRRVRWWLLIFPVLLIGGIVFAVKYPAMKRERALTKLGYTKEEAAAVQEAGLDQLITENGYYSHPLADAIRRGTLKKEYLPLYAAADDSSLLTDLNFLLYSRLAEAGYEEDQLINLFKNLEFNELVPLLTFDYQWDENDYIADCAEMRGENTNGKFELSGTYRTNYHRAKEIKEPDSTSVLVNKTYYLSEHYAPSDLINITTEYSVDGMRMRKEAGEAAVDMCMNALSDGNAFFIASSYMGYESINNSYNYFVKTEGERAADLMVGKAGFCEFQTGLSCTFAATYEKYEDFRTTDCYKWLSKNAAKYGFIERCPENKEIITGCEADASYFRYIGKELAKKVSASGLTYDEYWCLFLREWDPEAQKPADTLIESALSELTE